MPIRRKTSNQKIPQYILDSAASYRRTKSIRRINKHGLPVFNTSKECSEHKDRPQTCQTRGCNSKASVQGGERQGYYWQMWCGTCFKKDRARRRGITLKEYQNSLAKENGYLSHGDRARQSHKYLKYRKDYCENIDSRLGFKCTTQIINPQTHPEVFKNSNVDPSWNQQLQVDHKNGDPSDNSESNIQTLCVCCHMIKTALNEDYRSPGRKALGV